MLTLLQLNDLHGYIEPHPELVREKGEWTFAELGGLARIATLFDRVRAETEGAVIALDNGDTFHGTHVAVASRGHALVPLMNALKMDAMTVHWEFAYTPTGVCDLAERLDYPMLAINCYRKDDGALLLAPWRVVERGGLRVGIIGIACPIVDKTMPPAFSEGVRFTIGNEELPGTIRHLRDGEGVDLIVVLSHLGFPHDVKLARETDGIDVIVSGHTHNRMHEAIVENGAIIFQSGCHGSFVGQLDLAVEDGRIASHRHQLIALDESIAEDGDVARMVEDALAPARAEMSRIVGQIDAPLHRYAMAQSPMDDILLRAITEAAGTDIAFSNGWRYGAPIAPGPVTLNELWNIIPTNPDVSTVELTGTELRTMIEENLERTFAADPYNQMGGYVKRMRGLKLFLKAENPSGRRIDRLFAGTAEVEAEKLYKVAFVTEQGVPAKFGINRAKTGVTAIDALERLFAKAPITRYEPIQTVFLV